MSHVREHSLLVELVDSEAGWPGFESWLCHFSLVRPRAGSWNALCLSLLKCKPWGMALPELAVRSKGACNFQRPAGRTVRSGPSAAVRLLLVLLLACLSPSSRFQLGPELRAGSAGLPSPALEHRRGPVTAVLCHVCLPCFLGTDDFRSRCRHSVPRAGPGSPGGLVWLWVSLWGFAPAPRLDWPACVADLRDGLCVELRPLPA